MEGRHDDLKRRVDRLKVDWTHIYDRVPPKARSTLIDLDQSIADKQIEL